jgi:uncharacterized protein (TIGR02271 family)
MMSRARVKPGAEVEATDGRFGAVREVLVDPKTGELAQLLVEHDGGVVLVPGDLIHEIPSPTRVRLDATREEARARLAGVVSLPELGGQLRIPVHEERLRVDVLPADLGELRVHKSVERVPETVTHAVERDELEVERVRLDRLIDEPVTTRQEDGWLIVPIMEEVLVVTKQLVLTEEVRIRTRRVIEEQEVYEILRRERVEIEDATMSGTADTTRLPSPTGDRPAQRASHQSPMRTPTLELSPQQEHPTEHA